MVHPLVLSLYFQEAISKYISAHLMKSELFSYHNQFSSASSLTLTPDISSTERIFLPVYSASIALSSSVALKVSLTARLYGLFSFAAFSIFFCLCDAFVHSILFRLDFIFNFCNNTPKIYCIVKNMPTLFIIKCKCQAIAVFVLIPIKKN